MPNISKQVYAPTGTIKKQVGEDDATYQRKLDAKRDQNINQAVKDFTTGFTTYAQDSARDWRNLLDKAQNLLTELTNLANYSTLEEQQLAKDLAKHLEINYVKQQIDEGSYALWQEKLIYLLANLLFKKDGGFKPIVLDILPEKIVKDFFDYDNKTFKAEQEIKNQLKIYAKATVDQGLNAPFTDTQIDAIEINKAALAFKTKLLQSIGPSIMINEVTDGLIYHAGIDFQTYQDKYGKKIQEGEQYFVNLTLDAALKLQKDRIDAHNNINLSEFVFGIELRIPQNPGETEANFQARKKKINCAKMEENRTQAFNRFTEGLTALGSSSYTNQWQSLFAGYSAELMKVLLNMKVESFIDSKSLHKLPRAHKQDYDGELLELKLARHLNPIVLAFAIDKNALDWWQRELVRLVAAMLLTNDGELSPLAMGLLPEAVITTYFHDGKLKADKLPVGVTVDQAMSQLKNDLLLGVVQTLYQEQCIDLLEQNFMEDVAEKYRQELEDQAPNLTALVLDDPIKWSYEPGPQFTIEDSIYYENSYGVLDEMELAITHLNWIIASAVIHDNLKLEDKEKVPQEILYYFAKIELPEDTFLALNLVCNSSILSDYEDEKKKGLTSLEMNNGLLNLKLNQAKWVGPALLEIEVLRKAQFPDFVGADVSKKINYNLTVTDNIRLTDGAKGLADIRGIRIEDILPKEKIATNEHYDFYEKTGKLQDALQKRIATVVKYRNSSIGRRYLSWKNTMRNFMNPRDLPTKTRKAIPSSFKDPTSQDPSTQTLQPPLPNPKRSSIDKNSMNDDTSNVVSSVDSAEDTIDITNNTPDNTQPPIDIVTAAGLTKDEHYRYLAVSDNSANPSGLYVLAVLIQEIAERTLIHAQSNNQQVNEVIADGLKEQLFFYSKLARAMQAFIDQKQPIEISEIFNLCDYYLGQPDAIQAILGPILYELVPDLLNDLKAKYQNAKAQIDSQAGIVLPTTTVKELNTSYDLKLSLAEQKILQDHHTYLGKQNASTALTTSLDDLITYLEQQQNDYSNDDFVMDPKLLSVLSTLAGAGIKFVDRQGALKDGLYNTFETRRHNENERSPVAINSTLFYDEQGQRFAILFEKQTADLLAGKVIDRKSASHLTRDGLHTKYNAYVYRDHVSEYSKLWEDNPDSALQQHKQKIQADLKQANLPALNIAVAGRIYFHPVQQDSIKQFVKEQNSTSAVSDSKTLQFIEFDDAHVAQINKADSYTLRIEPHQIIIQHHQTKAEFEQAILLAAQLIKSQQAAGQEPPVLSFRGSKTQRMVMERICLREGLLTNAPVKPDVTDAYKKRYPNTLFKSDSKPAGAQDNTADEQDKKDLIKQIDVQPFKPR
ncbi:MAG: hypothetical protein Tsb005_08000 [Gammaproteobacteria bacterium]